MISRRKTAQDILEHWTRSGRRFELVWTYEPIVVKDGEAMFKTWASGGPEGARWKDMTRKKAEDRLDSIALRAALGHSR